MIINKTLGSLLDLPKRSLKDYYILCEEFSNTASSSDFETNDHYLSEIDKKCSNDEIYNSSGAHLLVKGIYHFYHTQFQISIDVILELVEGEYPEPMKGGGYMLLGGAYRSQGKIDLSVKNLMLCAEICERSGYFQIIHTYSLYQLAEIHLLIDELQEAKVYYKKGLEFIQPLDHTAAKFRLNNGLASCYLRLGEFKKAREYNEIALNN